MSLSVGVVILNYTDSATADSIACLVSLEAAHKHTPFASYVVATSCKTEPFLSHSLSPTVLSGAENLGFAGGNNWGAREALKGGCDVVVFLNNDTVVDAHFLTPLLQRLNMSGVGLVSPKIYFGPGCEFHRDSYAKTEQGTVLWYAGGRIDWENVYAFHRGVDEVDHSQFDTAVQTDFATGCCMAVKADVLKKTGGFDERYFLYWEDTDLSIRTIRSGLSCWYEPKSVIWHKNAGSTGGAGSETHVYYQTRNRLLFGMRYAPIKTKAALMRQALFMLKNGTAAEKRGVVDFFKGSLWKKTT